MLHKFVLIVCSYSFIVSGLQKEHNFTAYIRIYNFLSSKDFCVTRNAGAFYPQYTFIRKAGGLQLACHHKYQFLLKNVIDPSTKIDQIQTSVSISQNLADSGSLETHSQFRLKK